MSYSNSSLKKCFCEKGVMEREMAIVLVSLISFADEKIKEDKKDDGSGDWRKKNKELFWFLVIGVPLIVLMIIIFIVICCCCTC